MPDLLEQTQDHIDQMTNLQILAIRNNICGESLTECEECGGTIPEKRRKTIRGVRTCVGCQEVRELALRLSKGLSISGSWGA